MIAFRLPYLIKPIANFNLLNSDSSPCNILSQPLLFSFKKDRNLPTFLVKGTLPSNKEPGTFRCSRKQCLTFPFVVSRTSVTGPKSTLNITEHFNCTTPNFIYSIQCSNCNNGGNYCRKTKEMRLIHALGRHS